MIEIKNKVVSQKGLEILQNKENIIHLYDNKMMIKINHYYDCLKDDEDETLGKETKCNFEISYIRKSAIIGVGVCYSNNGEVFFISISTNDTPIYMNVESQKRGEELVEIIQHWLFDEPKETTNFDLR